MFDWRTFLDTQGIHYVERGRNVSRGNLAIKCPFCNDDPSEHMNVSLNGYGYACWRDAEHRSRGNAKLVQILLSCTWTEANNIVGGEQAVVPTLATFREQVEKFLDKHGPRKLQMPKAWQPLHKPGGPMRSLVLEYVKSRGYSEHDAIALAKRYEMYCSAEGGWKKRVLWPLRDENGVLVNYIGRAVNNKFALRYKAVAGDKATLKVSECLFDLHNLVKVEGEALIICEGPFDAMRLGWVGEALGVFTTCIFTVNISERQMDLARLLRRRFARMFILFDKGAFMQAVRAQTYLQCSRLEIPKGIKDPGELSPSQALAMCREALA
jgi:hypothetical protein